MSAYEFKWRAGFPTHGANAAKCGRELLAISKTKNVPIPAIKAADVVHYAQQSRDSELGKFFDGFNKNAAAQAHWESIARGIVGAIQVTIRGGQKVIHEPVRAHVNIIKDDGERGYVERSIMMKNPDLRAQEIRRGWKELRSWYERWASFGEFDDVRHEINVYLAEYFAERPVLVSDRGADKSPARIHGVVQPSV